MMLGAPEHSATAPIVARNFLRVNPADGLHCFLTMFPPLSISAVAELAAKRLEPDLL
jgi:hypothetical protein